MNTINALQIVKDFKGTSLKHKLDELQKSLKGKKKEDIIILNDIYEAALEIKKISSQVDEIVHATGIVKCLPNILDKDEQILSLSLAAGAEGDGIDLVTNKRIAEFKFSVWQEKGNGTRKRQVFADLVNLFLLETTRKKELYVIDAEKIMKFLTSKKASWKNVLSKSGGLDKKLEKQLTKLGFSGMNLNDVYVISSVEVKDINEILVNNLK